FPFSRLDQPAGTGVLHADDTGAGSQLDGVTDASVAERRRSRTVGDQSAGIVRIEQDLGNGVGAGLHSVSVKELGYVLRSVEIDLQFRVLAGASNPRRHRNVLPSATAGARVRIGIDAHRLNVEKNILKVRRRDAHKSDLDRRIFGGAGRPDAGQQHAGQGDEGYYQGASNPMHKKIFHSKSIEGELGQRLG